ncbi:MAG: hypothetical protein GY719_36525 [bacterium]|nr:hypothetical protein [bacterium]
MRLFASLIAVCALAVPLRAEEPTLEDWTIARHEWSGELAEGHRVEIINVHGDVRVRAPEGREVFFLALIQHHNDDPRRPEITTEQGEGRLKLEVLYPPAEDAEGNEIPESEIPEAWRKRRVDLTVFVPKTAATSVTTAHGLAEVRGLRGDLEVSTEKGEIRARISGALRAKTVHGDVMAQFRRTDWASPSKVETLTGSILAEMPAGGEADVRIATRGEITTDYTLVITKPDGGRLKHGKARIGEAGGELVLESNRGAIKLIESAVPKEDG